MPPPIILAEQLGKRYRIGERDTYVTLRDAISRLFKQRLRGSSRDARSDEKQVWALRDVSFEVHHGHVVGLIGRNGAGKSTLLKILSRITRPTEGYAEVHGKVGSLLEVGTGFHPELTGRENVYLNGAILGMRKREIDRKFDEIVAFAETSRFIDTPIKYYSSGMQVRLAFAVAAHLEPEILLIDEVLAVGDAAFQKKCLGKMEDAAGEGRTVFFVSHNMHAVASLCDSAIWLESGRVRSIGPASEQVAKYTAAVLSQAESRAASDDDRHGPVLIRSIRLVDDDGKEVDHFDPLASFAIEFEVAQRQLEKPLRFVVRIRSATDDSVVLATTNWDAKDPQHILEAANYKVRCVIPGNLLNVGAYSISLGADEPRGPVHVRYDDIKRFVVVSTSAHGDGIYGTRDGVLSPFREWEIVPLRRAATEPRS